MNHKKFLYIYIIIFSLLLTASALNGEYAIRLNKGDTIYKIAKEYGIPPEIILKMNSIKDPTKIKVGTNINIPLVYRIKQGDTLTSICKNFGITPESVLEYNTIPDKEKLHEGNKLYLLVDASYHKSYAETGKNGENLSWPLSGTREKLTGKLSGAVIIGKTGDKIVSVSYGRVIWAGPYRGYGKMIFIKSESNYVYIYAGNEQILVKVGEMVKIDTPIGVLGESSRDGQAKAIFCMYIGKKSLDPFTTLRE